MTVTITPLVEYKFIEDTQSTQFTATSTTIIDAVAATNTTTDAATLSLSIVSDGGVPASSNMAISDRVIRAGETYLCPDILGQALLVGDYVSAISDTASALSIRISGRVIT